MPLLVSRAALGAFAVAAPLLAVAGCADVAPSGGTSATGSAPTAAAVRVKAGDRACSVSDTSLDSGITEFSITNSGSDVTEVYVYASGDRIVTEKENIGPGTSYDLTVDLPPGSYQVACKPGMVGDGIRSDVTVAAATRTQAQDPAAAKAVADYRAYVLAQAQASLPLVQRLRDAVAASDRTAAQAAYAPSRVPWERIEPVAESFGDLDPRMDAREADLGPGDTFSGWHRLEKALWTGEDLAPVVPVADQLLTDVGELAQRVPNAALTPTAVGNGAQALMDEVATGKVTGEEEAFSHTDLVDFKGNLDGAQQAFAVLRPVVQDSEPALVAELDSQFAAVQAALLPYQQGTGYVSYDTVPADGRRALARAVDALSAPLSQLGAAASGRG